MTLVLLALVGVTLGALLFLSPSVGPHADDAPAAQPTPPNAPGSGTPKQKVAILGGGVGAITTAFELTQPNQRDR